MSLDVQTSPILIVEDDQTLRETMEWTLEDAGWPVTCAVDGREALEMAERSRPSLVVLDIALPVLSGHRVADGLRRMYPEDIPILVVTADGRASTKARQVGAYGYLAKPFSLDDLVAAVNRGLRSA